jgi:hypothetical protein
MVGGGLVLLVDEICDSAATERLSPLRELEPWHYPTKNGPARQLGNRPRFISSAVERSQIPKIQPSLPVDSVAFLLPAELFRRRQQ